MIVDLISADPGPGNDGRIFAVVDVTNDEGITTRLTHVFPPDTIEWRVAEYGFDPLADADLLLDIVLLEPHISIPDELRLYQTDRESAKQALVDAVHKAKGESQAQKVQIRAAKRLAKSDADAEDAREKAVRGKILALSFLDPEVVEEKRKVVDRMELTEQGRMKRPQPVDRKLAFKRQAEFTEKGKKS